MTRRQHRALTEIGREASRTGSGMTHREDEDGTVWATIETPRWPSGITVRRIRIQPDGARSTDYSVARS